MAFQPLPGQDQPVALRSDLTVIRAINAFRTQAMNAKRTRMKRNRRNMETYLGRQDWSNKLPGQSTEFLPKVPTALEQLAAFIKRGLTQFGDWYSVDVGKRQLPLTAEEIRALVNCYIENLPDGSQGSTDFRIRLTDVVKLGALEALMVLKIHGQNVDERRFVAEPGRLTLDPETGEVVPIPPSLATQSVPTWRLRIDIVPGNDYYPDPTGNGLFEIHSSEHDLHHVVEMAEAGLYDPAVVELIKDSTRRPLDERRRPQDMAHDEDRGGSPEFRKTVVIDEFWGTMLDEEGRVTERNVLAAVANSRWLIRPPEPNPFWHGESPFVSAPLIRVPMSVWHKALYDHASDLNIALNELFNLMLDGALAAVWGTRQLRIDWLKDPSDVSSGIPQGKTLAINSTVPAGAKVLETVTEGNVPRDAMAIFEMVVREFNQSALTSETRLGQLPPGQVKATAIVEASQSQAVTLDALVADVEQDLIQKVLRKSFLTILQNADDLSSEDVVAAIGPRAASVLLQMSPPERFAAFAGLCTFKPTGLSATLTKVRDFQKTQAFLQSVITNPLLLQSFMQKYDPDKLLMTLMRQLNINPETLYRDQAGQERLAEDMRTLPLFQQLISGPGGSGGGAQPRGLSAQGVGDASLPAEINQAANPLTGMNVGGSA